MILVVELKVIMQNRRGYPSQKPPNEFSKAEMPKNKEIRRTNQCIALQYITKSGQEDLQGLNLRGINVFSSYVHLYVNVKSNFVSV